MNRTEEQPPTPLQLPTLRARGVRLHPCKSIGQGPVRRLTEHVIWVILEVKKKRPFMICGQGMVQNLGLVSAATSSGIGGGEAGQVRGGGELGSWGAGRREDHPEELVSAAHRGPTGEAREADTPDSLSPASYLGPPLGVPSWKLDAREPCQRGPCRTQHR